MQSDNFMHSRQSIDSLGPPSKCCSITVWVSNGDSRHRRTSLPSLRISLCPSDPDFHLMGLDFHPSSNVHCQRVDNWSLKRRWVPDRNAGHGLEQLSPILNRFLQEYSELRRANHILLRCTLVQFQTHHELIAVQQVRLALEVVHLLVKLSCK
jgi:hypothetical protein